jgi:hypothetical protein
MSSREERMAKNEATSRELNEEIEAAYESEPASNRFDMVCECALEMCDRSIDITMDEYRHVRMDLGSSLSCRSTSSGTSTGSFTKTTVSPS